MARSDANHARADVTMAVACKTSPRNGLVAWGAVLRSGLHAKTVGGCARPDDGMTPSGAAIQAIHQALLQLNRPCRLTIRTTSYYVQHAIPNLGRWARDGWERSDNTGMMLEPVANADLWQALIEQIRHDGHVVSEWTPVGGHRAFETKMVGDMLHIIPLGPIVPRNTDDGTAAEMALAVLQRAIRCRAAAAPGGDFRQSADRVLQADEAPAAVGMRP